MIAILSADLDALEVQGSSGIFSSQLDISGCGNSHFTTTKMPASRTTHDIERVYAWSDLACDLVPLVDSPCASCYTEVVVKSSMESLSTPPSTISCKGWLCASCLSRHYCQECITEFTAHLGSTECDRLAIQQREGRLLVEPTEPVSYVIKIANAESRYRCSIQDKSSRTSIQKSHSKRSVQRSVENLELRTGTRLILDSAITIARSVRPKQLPKPPPFNLTWLVLRSRPTSLCGSTLQPLMYEFRKHWLLISRVEAVVTS